MFVQEDKPHPHREPGAGGNRMGTPSDLFETSGGPREGRRHLGESYFVLGMAVQVGLVGLVGLALIGVQGMGFITMGTAMALAGLAIGILAVGSILTLASLRYTMNVLYEHDDQLESLGERQAAMANELGMAGDVAVGWGTTAAEEEYAPPPLETGEAEDTQRGPDRPSDPMERRPDPGPGSGPDPMVGGQVHSVIEVEGIDAEAAQTLNEMGIVDTEDLFAANTMYVAGRLELEPEEVEQWQSTAEFMAVEGISNAEAELLADVGFTSLAELSHETPERVLRRIEQREGDLTTEMTGENVGVRMVQGWIEAARAHRSREGRQPATGSHGEV